jgi:endoglucanase
MPSTKPLLQLLFTLAALIGLSSCNSYNPPDNSPVAKNGWLHTQGNKLINEHGEQVQLRGVATHGLQWYGDFYKDGNAIKQAAVSWGVDVVRLSVYVYEGGYLDNKEITPEGFDKMIEPIIENCIATGTYVILDWHVHHPGDPAFYLKDAKEFFTKHTEKYGQYPNLIWEIANEPNEAGMHHDDDKKRVTWPEIKAYAKEIIPVVRAKAPKSLILMGTPDWSSFGIAKGKDVNIVINDPIDDDNVAYTFHFYAGGHKFSEKLDYIASKVPVFITEWAACSWDMGSPNDMESTAKWTSVMNKHKISWTYWNYAPGTSSYSIFKTADTTDSGLDPKGDNITPTGELLYKLLNK